MQLKQEIALIEFTEDTHLDLIITETIRYQGVSQRPFNGLECCGVSEQWGLRVEVPYLQIEFWKGNQLQVRILESREEDNYMTVDIVAVPEHQEHGFIGQLAIIDKHTMKILSVTV